MKGVRGRAALGAFAIGMTLGLAGCGMPVATQAFVAPNALDASTPYNSYVVYAAFKDLAVEGRFEKAMCRRLVRVGDACTTLLSVAPPTQVQTGASRQRAANRSGAQAILLIELANPETTSRRVLADGRPGFRISLIDVRSQQVVARFTIDPQRRAPHLRSTAALVAKATVAQLAQHGL